MLRSISRATLAAALLLCALSFAPAEKLKSQLGFYVEMPAGFTLMNGDGKARFAFADPKGGMEFDIIGYEAGRFADAATFAKESLTKLGSGGETTAYSYDGRDAVLADFLLTQPAVFGDTLYAAGCGHVFKLPWSLVPQ